MKPLSRLMAVTRKEVRQMRRDRLTFAMIFGIPLMQIILFGYAINTDVRNLKTAVADEATSRSPEGLHSRPSGPSRRPEPGRTNVPRERPEDPS